MSRPGFTFVVEPIEASKTYGGDKRRHREPTASPSLQGAWRKMIPTDNGMIEAMSPAPDGTVEVFTRQNLFAKAVHAAFFGHHGLRLSPDVIWLTIMQGLANHVDQNAEALRDRFVSHEGKEEIVIERPGFVKGSPSNDWTGVFPEFAEKIAEKTKGGVAELAQCDFSTTTPVERIVSQIALMDTVQHYFQYTMCCGCGFPSITLTGTPTDWERIRAKAEQLRSYDLDWWLDALLPALDQFVQAAHGRPNLDFWRSLCHINTGSSFPVFEPVTGWLQVFFPYLLAPGFDDGFGRGGGFDEAKGGAAKKKLRRNGGLANYAQSVAAKVNAANFGAQRRSGSSRRDSWNPPEGTGDGIKLELFPPGLSSAPFTYKDAMTDLQHKMAFYGGSTCLVQHADGDLEPKVGWAVLDSGVLVGGPQPKQPLAEAKPQTNVQGSVDPLEKLEQLAGRSKPAPLPTQGPPPAPCARPAARHPASPSPAPSVSPPIPPPPPIGPEARPSLLSRRPSSAAELRAIFFRTGSTAVTSPAVTSPAPTSPAVTSPPPPPPPGWARCMGQR